MRFTKSILICLFAVLAYSGASQIPIVPDQFRVNLEEQEIRKMMKFYQLNFRTPTIDLRPLKPLVDVDIPDSIVVVPPSLSNFDHVVVLIGLVEGDASSMVVWLAGNYNYRNITFFLDKDQDRDFTNDVDPIKIKAGSAEREVILTQDGVDRKMWLSVPEIEVKRIEKYKVRIANRFAIAFNMGVGTGETNYRYDDLTIGHPTNYFVKITEKNLTTSITYDFKNFNLGVTASFQNHFYFTSHLDVKKGEPFFRIIAGVRPIYEDNIDHHVNLDLHSNNRIQYSLFGTYKVKVGRAIDVQAFARVGRTSYFIPEYNRLVREEDQTFPLRSSPFYEIGLRSEFTVGISKAFFIEIARNENKWVPEGFLDDTPHENFESESIIVKLNVGYRFAL
ncbi:MAG: hypothetical protein ABJG78_02510 [Cyclobacteriaceae bacterium]